MIGDAPLDVLMAFSEASSWSSRAGLSPAALKAIAREYRDGLDRDPEDSDIKALLAFNRD